MSIRSEPRLREVAAQGRVAAPTVTRPDLLCRSRRRGSRAADRLLSRALSRCLTGIHPRKTNPIRSWQSEIVKDRMRLSRGIWPHGAESSRPFRPPPPQTFLTLGLRPNPNILMTLQREVGCPAERRSCPVQRPCARPAEHGRPLAGRARRPAGRGTRFRRSVERRSPERPWWRRTHESAWLGKRDLGAERERRGRPNVAQDVCRGVHGGRSGGGRAKGAGSGRGCSAGGRGGRSSGFGRGRRRPGVGAVEESEAGFRKPQRDRAQGSSGARCGRWRCAAMSGDAQRAAWTGCGVVGGAAVFLVVPGVCSPPSCALLGCPRGLLGAVQRRPRGALRSPWLPLGLARRRPAVSSAAPAVSPSPPAVYDRAPW